MDEAFKRRWLDLRNSIQEERIVHKIVEDLVLCGVRPKVIHTVLAKRISVNDVRRIHVCVSPLPPSERHGRNIKIAAISQLPFETHSLYLEAFALVEKGIKAGANKADALAAAWRIVSAARAKRPHQEVEGGTCEEMIVLFLNYEIGDLETMRCGACSAVSLWYGTYRCVACDAQAKRTKKLAA